MKIHEYQAKALLARHGVAVPRGEPAFSALEAGAVARRLGGRVVVKAQIHAGGRGKGGGVRVAADADEAERIAGEMLGMTLVTPQTGPGGRVVGRLLIEEALDVARELYFGVLVDRSAGRPVMMASSAGGMDIEEVAADRPQMIHRLHVDPGFGPAPFQTRRLAGAVGLSGGAARGAAAVMARAGGAFIAADASLVEINPLVVTAAGAVLALDAKVALDDNASFRHADLADLRDPAEEDPLEVDASGHGLNYIRLDGDIGCMVNGAGLAMATMDVIKLAGAEPANFLDVGGGATKETVAAGFRILLKDKKVKGIFINVFGGIVRCERIAYGVIDAAKEVGITLPVVVRLQGTNAEEGRTLLTDSGLHVDVATDLWEAAQKIVAMKRSPAVAGNQ